MTRDGPAPSAEHIAEVRALRHAVDESLRTAVALMGRR